MAAAAAGDNGSAAARRAMLEALYRAFNQRDIDAVLEHLAPGVDWPNATTGGRVRGREAVRAYWLKQWKEIDPTVEPMRIDMAADGSAHVLVDQMIRSLDGEILQNRQVEHVYEFNGAFITRMTIIGREQGEVDRDDEDGGEGGEGEQGGEAGQ